MKKLILGFLSLFFIGLICIAQPVSDIAVIPMGITIQSIMRLNVTNGGNMEFVFGRLSDINTGIPAPTYSAAYQTDCSIAASQNWDLELYADNTDFSDGTNTIPVGVIRYQVIRGALMVNTTAIAANTLLTNAAVEPLAWAAVVGSDNLGDVTVNTFSIQWQCGAGAIKVGGHPAGRYTVNVLLSLKPHD